MKATIVVTSPRAWPLNSGSLIRTNRLVRGLSEAFHVVYVTPQHPPNSAFFFERHELEASLPGVEIHTVAGMPPVAAGFRNRGTQVRGLVRLRPWTWSPYSIPGFGAALRRIVSIQQAALVHFDDAMLGMYSPIPGALNVYAPHNIEHRIVREETRAGSIPRRLFAHLEWRLIEMTERAIWQRMALCLAVSEVDADAMREGGAQEVALCPNGTDPMPRLPPRSRGPDSPVRVLFVGSGHYPPYRRGLEWFIGEVLPRAQSRIDIEFVVVGQPPPGRITAPNVTYTGVVPSVAPWYRESDVTVVPVFEGSGTRLKIVEAMAHGRPVVSTRLGAEGLPVEPRTHYLQADDAGSFAEAVLAAAGHGSDASEVQRMIVRAHEAASELFWPRITERLIETYRTLIERVKSSRRSASIA